jgi:hypothetical protein
MDLAGPKIRTGGIEGARRIATWKPVRSELGRVTAPARVELWRASLAPVDGPQPLLLLDEDTFAALRAGDTLHLEDTRGKARSLTVDEVRAEVVVALGSQHTYLLDQVEVRVERDGKRLCKGTLRVGGRRGRSARAVGGGSVAAHLARRPRARRDAGRRRQGRQTRAHRLHSRRGAAEPRAGPARQLRRRQARGGRRGGEETRARLSAARGPHPAAAGEAAPRRRASICRTPRSRWPV